MLCFVEHVILWSRRRKYARKQLVRNLGELDMAIPYPVRSDGTAYVDEELYHGMLRAQLKNKQLAAKKHKAEAANQRKIETEFLELKQAFESINLENESLRAQHQLFIEKQRFATTTGELLQVHLESIEADCERLQAALDSSRAQHQDCAEKLEFHIYAMGQYKARSEGYGDQLEAYFEKVMFLQTELLMWRLMAG